MTTINSIPSVTQPTPQQESKKSFGTNFNTAMATGGTVGFAADIYLNSSKAVPKSYLKKIEKIIKELPKQGAEQLKEALGQAKDSLSKIVGQKYDLLPKIMGTARRDDAEAALTPLTKVKGLPKEVEKQVSKLAKIGENATDNLDVLNKKGFGKAVINGVLKQTKFAIIGTGVALAGLLGYQAIKDSKTPKA